MEYSSTQLATLEIPAPRLTEGRFASITAYTDQALFEVCGVRIVFTERMGGVSDVPYDSLNLGSHVGDKWDSVKKNRQTLLDCLGCGEASMLVPSQVHGKTVLTIDSPEAAASWLARAEADPKVKECDAITVECAGVAAQLNFADCVPVIIVAPNGDFSVVHAGWRGVENLISVEALEGLAKDVALKCSMPVADAIASSNVYIGPHIMGECFEISAEIHDRFVRAFGSECDVDPRHIELSAALKTQLVRAGVTEERIASLGMCTVCNNDKFFSYRGQGGVCGRHGAFAIRCL